MKQILTKRGEVKELIRIFGCTEPTVINSLRFRSNTELAIQIRNTAIRRGGVEVK